MSCVTQNNTILTKLLKFYKNEENLDIMLDIINGQSIISLRIVDWFVTNYAKKYFTIIENPKRLNVYKHYKLNLKSYKKIRFDPFCRYNRISIPYKDNTFIQTTIGQINFFKWAIENNIINYISENYETIEKDMKTRNGSLTDKSSTNKTRKKREELSIYASKSIKKENVEITISFGSKE